MSTPLPTIHFTVNGKECAVQAPPIWTSMRAVPSRWRRSLLSLRIALFVDHSWHFCNSPRYQASLQILLGLRNDGEQPQDFEPWINATLGQVVGEGFDLWQQVFRDVGLDENEFFDTLLYLFSSLSGSALLARISQVQERVDSDLRVLKHLLLLRFSKAKQPSRHVSTSR